MSGKQGMAYVVVLLMVLLLSSMGLAFLYSVRTRTLAATGRLDALQAQYLAESAANHVLWRLLNEADDSNRYVRQIRDDSEQEADGKCVLDNSDLSLGESSYVGLRFLDVAVPRGATVNVARVQFTASMSDSTLTDITIYGEDTDDAGEFSNSVVNISQRPRTSASVTWNGIAPWSKDAAYLSPDLSPIIQEIVDRPGWVEGNDLVLLFRSTRSSGKRRFYARDNSTKVPALLTISHGDQIPMTSAGYTMHALAGGRYGYKVRIPTPTTFATVAAVGAMGETVAGQSYVLKVVPRTRPSLVIVDKVTTKADANKSSATWGHAVAGGNNRLLVVCISSHGTRAVSAVTYAGIPLTLLGTVFAPDDERYVAMWYLLNPPVGNADVSVTFELKTHFRIGAVSFFNVDQAAPFGPLTGSSGNSSLPTVSVPSAAGDLVLDTMACRRISDPVSCPFDQAEQWNDKGGDAVWGAGSTRDGAAAVEMSWSLNRSGKWAMGAVSIHPAASAP